MSESKVPQSAMFDPLLGYVPCIPEPFWYSGWRTLFRYRPACYGHGQKPLIFRNRREYEVHYALNHVEPLEPGE